jgi:NAD(P)-dependent dehydrogenase (short-subunit alcohol dehydrogenase family)
MDVTAKVAVITGGGRGIGRGIALVLARNGADVVVADLDLENARSVADEVSETGRQSLATQVDVRDDGSVDRMVSESIERFGRIDILVNNAGVIGSPGWGERRTRPNEEDWDLIYEVNVKGLARVTDAVTPHMIERRYGKVVNIASIAGRIGSVTNIPYSASKAGVINITQSRALELAPSGINVNAVCPGLIWSAMWDAISGRWGQEREDLKGLTHREIFERQVKERIPLGREQTPEEIGHAVAFLASDYAASITGQAINVSGGSHLN